MRKNNNINRYFLLNKREKKDSKKTDLFSMKKKQNYSFLLDIDLDKN